MSQFSQEPSNWRNVAKVTHVDGYSCANIRKRIGMSLESIGCSWDNCNDCKLSVNNPKRAAYIQQCKDRLAEEQKMEDSKNGIIIPEGTQTMNLASVDDHCKKKPYDLTKEGPVLSLEPVVVQLTDYADFSEFYTRPIVCINTKKQYPYMGDMQVAFQFARHIPTKTTRQMTVEEIAMLPRGTAFVHKACAAWKEYCVYSPVIKDYADIIQIEGVGIADYVGHRLPGSTEILPFTKEETV